MSFKSRDAYKAKLELEEVWRSIMCRPLRRLRAPAPPPRARNPDPRVLRAQARKAGTAPAEVDEYVAAPRTPAPLFARRPRSMGPTAHIDRRAAR